MNILQVNSDSDFDFIISSIGLDVSINGIPAKAVVINSNTNINFDDKVLMTKTLIKRGDLVTYRNNTYLIISEVNTTRQNSNIYKAIIRNTNYAIKFNMSGFIRVHHAIVDTSGMSLNSEKFLTLPDGKLNVYMQDNAYTSAISINQRFLIMGNAYSVVGKSRSEKGLLTLYCDVSVFQETDDQINEIANKTDVWSISITNGETASITNGDTLQLINEIKKNGIVTDNPGFTIAYNSSNPAIATVSNSGLITSQSEGTTTITVTGLAEANDTITDSIEITVISAVLPDNYTIDISGADEINYGVSQTYTATVKNNGTIVSQPVTFSIFSGSSYGTITSQNDTSCVVKNINDGTCVLKAVLDIDGSISTEKSIICKGMW